MFTHINELPKERIVFHNQFQGHPAFKAIFLKNGSFMQVTEKIFNSKLLGYGYAKSLNKKIREYMKENNIKHLLSLNGKEINEIVFE